MNKKQVLLVFGGRSSEHEVSMRTARNVYEAMDQAAYSAVLVHIDKNGQWRLVDDVRESTPDDADLVVNLGDNLFYAGSAKINVDVVFPLLHGKYGEDGTVQGMLDLIGSPYVGCGTEASALCMDKVRTKQLLRQAGIKVVDDVVVDASNSSLEPAAVTANLSSPWFVKPSRAGSSVGVSKVKDTTGLAAAINEALIHDSEVLVETAVFNPREIEVAVLGNLPNITVSEPGEIVPGEEFYSYEDKYSENSESQVITIASLSTEQKNHIQQIAKQAYCLLGCRGLARIDFLLSANNELYLNEINTMPGFTSISMFPKLIMQTGMSYQQLVDRLIELALE